MNWESITTDMLSAMQEQVGKDWPKMKEAARIFLQQRIERLAKLHELKRSGSIDEQFFQKRLWEEELLYRSELNALSISSLAAIRRATKAAFWVLTRSLLNAIF
ncbi:MAG: hypothetical protein ACK5A2_13160 [Bacteroidota bacterium]|jgi:hypothetical protein